MASLQISQNGKAIKGSRQKSFPTVDLTAMVDLAFLLITFFMLTTSLAKINSLSVVKPVDGIVEPSAWPASRTMTILLVKNSQAVYFLGNAETAAMKVVKISDLAKELQATKLHVANTHADKLGKRMLVIIKPTNASIYKDFVDIIDEMGINQISTYAIDDNHILAPEKRFIEKKVL